MRLAVALSWYLLVVEQPVDHRTHIRVITHLDRFKSNRVAHLFGHEWHYGHTAVDASALAPWWLWSGA